MKHKVQINVASKDGTSKVLEGTSTRMSARKAKRLFGGDFCEVICLKPGKKVTSIEIQEVADGKQD